MSEPRYRPNDYCADPELFGRTPFVDWFPTTNVRNAALSRAAQLQHHYAVRIRFLAKERNLERKDAAAMDADRNAGAHSNALKELADIMGISYVRLLRCLRGDVVMRLDDIAWAEQLFGTISEVAPPKASPRPR